MFVERDGQRLSGAASQPRRLALLALLASAGEHGLTRDRMLGLLWPETDEDRARRGLNQALYALRQEVGADEIFLGTRDVRLNPDLITSDVALFTEAVRSGRLDQAVAVYIGPFLDGFHISDAPEFERWLEEERAGLARDCATALRRLAEQASERGDHTGSAEWWRKLAAQDPLNGRVAVGLMEALVAAGDRSAALHHARVYEVLMQQELEAPPDAEVLALAGRIREQAAAMTPPAAAPGPSAREAPQPTAPPEGANAALPGAPAAVPVITVNAAAPGAQAAVPVITATEPAPRSAVLAQEPGGRRLAWGWWAVAAGALGAVALAAATVLRAPAPTAPRIGRISRLTAEPGLEVHPAVSPDGKFLAFAAGPTGRLRIYIRQLAGGRTISVADNLGGDQHWPRWSPDGTRLSLETNHAIYVVPALGGDPKLLVASTGPVVNGEGAWSEEGPSYLAWSPDGRRIAYAVGRDIDLRGTDGGPVTRLASLDQPHSLAWSPDGSRLTFVAGNAAFVYAPDAIGNIAPSAIWIVSAAGGAPTRITEAASLNTSPVWLPDGRGLLFISDRDGSRDLYRVELGRDGRPTGEPVRLTTGLGLHGLALSPDGRVLVYADFSDYANIWSLALPASGPVSSSLATALTTGHQSIEGLGLSPDGRWLAFDSDRGGHQAIYRVPVTGGDPQQISSDSDDDFMPSWSPDGRELAYYGFRQGRRRLFVMPVDGGSAGPVNRDSGNQRYPGWSPDGRHLVFHSDRSGRFELYVVERDTAGRWGSSRQLTTAGGQDARWSPDGGSILYLRNSRLWVIASAGGAPRLLVDVGDSAGKPAPLLAQWSPDGHTIYYKALDSRGNASLWAIPATGGEPRELVRFDDPVRTSSRAEFATDGRRLYFTASERESDLWRMELQSR
ncbi:MAG TPA: DPP IV N-terminal domain-containing protein [Gemmatimonadales bacterium]|nr:DPP IV N-terminal domain-containing protein [Gemmatimonadales bacterium]